MTRLLRSHRDLLLGGLAFVAATWLFSGSEPSAAAGTLFPRVDCVRPDGNSSTVFIAVFGYENTTSGAIAASAGPANNVFIDGSDVTATAGAPTLLDPGIHPGAFAIRFLSGQTVTWSLSDGGFTNVASATTASPNNLSLIHI